MQTGIDQNCLDMPLGPSFKASYDNWCNCDGSIIVGATNNFLSFFFQQVNDSASLLVSQDFDKDRLHIFIKIQENWLTFFQNSSCHSIRPSGLLRIHSYEYTPNIKLVNRETLIYDWWDCCVPFKMRKKKLSSSVSEALPSIILQFLDLLLIIC